MITGRHRLLRDWVLACLAGELLGIGTAAGVWGILNASVGEPATPGQRLTSLVILVLAGALEGLWLGLFQGRVVRRVLGVPVRFWAALGRSDGAGSPA